MDEFSYYCDIARLQLASYYLPLTYYENTLDCIIVYQDGTIKQRINSIYIDIPFNKTCLFHTFQLLQSRLTDPLFFKITEQSLEIFRNIKQKYDELFTSSPEQLLELKTQYKRMINQFKEYVINKIISLENKETLDESKRYICSTYIVKQNKMLFLSNYRKNMLKEYTDIDYNFNKYFKRHRKKQLCFLNIESCYIYYLLYNIELIFLKHKIINLEKDNRIDTKLYEKLKHMRHYIFDFSSDNIMINVIHEFFYDSNDILVK